MTFSPAKRVISSQLNIHKNLEKVILRHFQHSYKKPIAKHNQLAFEQAYLYWQQNENPPVILDSGCGTGESSRYLANIFPNHLIFGLDQSRKRLNHSANKHLPNNCLLLHCECSDFWMLAAQHQWKFVLHTILYPNPYPKSQHLQRRWHGHPAFKHLLTISEQIILRTNWEVYAEEFKNALNFSYEKNYWAKTTKVNLYQPVKPITAFERKYQKSGHDLWQVLSLTENKKNPL